MLASLPRDVRLEFRTADMYVVCIVCVCVCVCSGGSTSSDSDEPRNTFVVEVDDDADEDTLAVLLEPDLPTDISVVNTEVCFYCLLFTSLCG